jgi:hypothetical protein
MLDATKVKFAPAHFFMGLVVTALVTPAHSAVISIDDFSQPSAVVAGPPNSIGTPTEGIGFWTQRTISVFDAVGAPDFGAYALVTQGVFNINSGNLVKGTTELGYSFDFAKLSVALANATYYQITLDQVSIDNYTVVVGGGARVNAQNGLTVVVGAGSDINVLKSPFNVQFRSDFAADSSWDNLKITYTCKKDATAADLSDLNAQDGCGTNGTVPLAPTFGLIGVGLLGLLGTRKRN